MERKVGIVGAGISGILACKYVLSKGYHPFVFETQPMVGGVWTKTVETTKLQTPKILYEFSDFAWPSSVKTDYPNQNQVFEYLQSYVNHFNLLKHIKFNTKVLSIEYEGASMEEMEAWDLWGGNGEPFGKDKWIITFQNLPTLSIEVMQVDFVILCVGRHSDIPKMPEFPIGKGPEEFEGKVIHAMDYASMDYSSARALVKGKRVTVVGFQKSALDMAKECSIANGVENPCTVICRRPHWILPDLYPWGVPITCLYFTRFSEYVIHKPGQGPFLSLLATLLSPLRWGISKFVESYIKRKHPLKKYDMIPNHSFLHQMNSCLISIMPEGFYENVEKGSIILKRSPTTTFGFNKQGISLVDDNNNNKNADDQVIKSDLVILATGFNGDQKLQHIFVSPKFQGFVKESFNTGFPFYRECIHPKIPKVAIIGFTESLANLYTLELRCRWLAEFLDGKFKLPNITQMENNVLKWSNFITRHSGKCFRRSCCGPLHIWYNDQLCKDMGWNPSRKPGFWAELFEPYGPMDYANQH